jgi:hypothetical protein
MEDCTGYFVCEKSTELDFHGVRKWKSEFSRNFNGRVSPVPFILLVTQVWGRRKERKRNGEEKEGRKEEGKAGRGRKGGRRKEEEGRQEGRKAGRK